jgi:Tfp pilus assembly protein PilP
MKLITATLILGLATGSAWAQNPDLIENTRNTMKALQMKKAIDSNQALEASEGKSSKPTPATPAAAPQNKPAMTAPARVNTPQVKPVTMAAPQHATAPAKTKIEVVKDTTHKSGPFSAKAAAPGKKVKREMVKAHMPKPTPMQVAVEDKKNPVDPKKEKRVISFTGKRDPFVSPVVNHTMTGSGCSTGKKCLAIDQIALRGVVKSDDGMIAVVVNATDKAYFLRENDPVFNGYVVKITGDSIIFKETIEDKLGKPFTREVTKRISTPAV